MTRTEREMRNWLPHARVSASLFCVAMISSAGPSRTCGDIDVNGDVDVADVGAYWQCLANPQGSAMTDAGYAQCTVYGRARPCDVLDLVVLRRSLALLPALPPLGTGCVDGDLDGVADDADQCPETPSGAPTLAGTPGCSAFDAVSRPESLTTPAALALAAGTLESLLWPDADGDLAHRSLATNLHRLRRLLGSERLVVLHAGRVSLDPRRVWLDLWALDGHLTDPPSERSLDAALAMHSGPLLSGDDAAWIVSVRERQRTRLVRAIRAHGATLEAAGDLERASAWYERGFDLDERAEGLWQGLMVCHRDLGRPAEALAAYERCRTALARFGVGPSSTLQALANAMRG